MAYEMPHAYELPHDGDLPFVTITLAVVMTIIFLLYKSNTIKNIPCGNDLGSVIISQFVHVSFVHLIANLFTLWYLANLERNLGWQKFILLVVVIALISSAIDTIIGDKAGKRECSIGFSGVLFGLVAWSVLTTGGFKWYNVAMVAGLVLTNMGPHISVRGHVIGAVTGLILALVYNATRRK